MAFDKNDLITDSVGFATPFIVAFNLQKKNYYGDITQLILSMGLQSNMRIEIRSRVVWRLTRLSEAIRMGKSLRRRSRTTLVEVIERL